MKRTTIMLPDQTLARLRQEARKRGASVAEVVRTAVDAHLDEPEPVRRHLPFFGIAKGGLPPDAGTNHDKYLAEIYEERQRRREEDMAQRWGDGDADR